MPPPYGGFYHLHALPLSGAVFMSARLDQNPIALRGQKSTVLSIQYLRALAALSVVVFHLAWKLPLTQGQSLYFGIGAAGVDVFFAISGFVMCYTTASRPTSLAEFYWKRIVRIVPLYYLVTVAIILIVLALPRAANISVLTADHVVASFAFVAWPHPGWPSKLWPLNVPGWTLNYEMFFYLLLGGSLVFSSRSRHAVLSLTLLALVCSGLVSKPTQLLAFYTSPLLLEFLLGYLFGLAYLRGISFAPVTCIALAAISLVILFVVGPMVDPVDWQRFFRWGIPSLGLVVGVVLWDRASPLPELRLAHAAGDASYAIYLVQFVCVSAFEKVWQKLGLPLTGISQFGFLVCGTLAVSIFGWIVHRYVELPMTRGIRHIGVKQQLA